MSMMVSFVLSFFPRDVLDEILNLIESVSEDFPSYSHGVLIRFNAQGANAFYNRQRYLQPKSNKSATVIISNCNNQYKGELTFK